MIKYFRLIIVATLLNLIVFACSNRPKDLCRKWYVDKMYNNEDSFYVRKCSYYIDLNKEGTYISMGYIEEVGKWDYSLSTNQIIFNDTLFADIIELTDTVLIYELYNGESTITLSHTTNPDCEENTLLFYD